MTCQSNFAKQRIVQTRLTHEQHEFLLARFKQNPNWTADYVEELAHQLGCKPKKVYKWNWDRKKKVIKE